MSRTKKTAYKGLPAAVCYLHQCYEDCGVQKRLWDEITPGVVICHPFSPLLDP